MNEYLGKTCRDIVSGFEGICTGVLEWMYGCRQYTLQAKVNETENRKERLSSFFEKQLEVIDEGVTGKVEIPPDEPPKFFGKECRDKVTGIRGMCIGRMVWLFNSTQYIIEIPAKDPDKTSRLEWLDEGRVELSENPERELDPEEVKSPRPGGVFDGEEWVTAPSAPDFGR